MKLVKPIYGPKNIKNSPKLGINPKPKLFSSPNLFLFFYVFSRLKKHLILTSVIVWNILTQDSIILVTESFSYNYFLPLS